MKATIAVVITALVAAVQGVAIEKKRSTVCAGVDTPVCADLLPDGTAVSVSLPGLNTITLDQLNNVCVAKNLSPLCCASINGSGVGIDCYEA